MKQSDFIANECITTCKICEQVIGQCNNCTHWFSAYDVVYCHHTEVQHICEGCYKLCATKETK